MNASIKISASVEKLAPTHLVTDFDCGNIDLNLFLHKYALTNQQSNFSVSYVLPKDNKALGYYTLAAGAIERNQANERVAKGSANHPIPVMILARLAIDKNWQNQNLGQFLLRDALLRICRLSEESGIRAVMVNAKSLEIIDWYEKFGFQVSFFDPLTAFLLMKDLREYLRQNG